MNTLRRAAVGATAALTVLVPAGAAVAATSSSSSGNQPTAGKSPSAANDSRWQKVHEALVAALQARVRTLARLTTSVNTDRTLSPQDKNALNSRLSSETSGIGRLLTTVEAATPQNTTIAQLRADAKEMVDNYRVYLVMSRQVHLTEAADAQTSAEIKIEGNESRIDAAIGRAGNPPAAVAAYNDLVRQVANATTATGDAHIPEVLAVTPKGYPGDAGPLRSARSALGQAHTDLTAARGELQSIRNVLKQHDTTNRSAGASSSGSASLTG